MVGTSNQSVPEMAIDYISHSKKSVHVQRFELSTIPPCRGTKCQAQARFGLRLGTEAHAQTLRSIRVIKVDAWGLEMKFWWINGRLIGH